MSGKKKGVSSEVVGEGKIGKDRFVCIIDRDAAGWFGWLSPVDGGGNITDEYITARFARKHGSVCRLRYIANKMGFGVEAQDAITTAAEETTGI